MLVHHTWLSSGPGQAAEVPPATAGEAADGGGGAGGADAARDGPDPESAPDATTQGVFSTE